MSVVIEPLFSKGDYIINRSAGDIAIVKGISKKGYYQFDAYYNAMLNELTDLKKYTYELQVNYQKFFEHCNKDEKDKINKIIEERKMA